MLFFGGGLDAVELRKHLVDVVGDMVAECLAGGDALLQLISGTGIVAAKEQTGEAEAVGCTKLLLPLVLDGAA